MGKWACVPQPTPPRILGCGGGCPSHREPGVPGWPSSVASTVQSGSTCMRRPGTSGCAGCVGTWWQLAVVWRTGSMVGKGCQYASLPGTTLGRGPRSAECFLQPPLLHEAAHALQGGNPEVQGHPETAVQHCCVSPSHLPDGKGQSGIRCQAEPGRHMAPRGAGRPRDGSRVLPQQEQSQGKGPRAAQREWGGGA